MTTPDLISHVNEAIAKALRGESYIDASVLDIKGFSTATQRHLVSNLAHLPKKKPVYLEVGLYAGATFCAALSNNPDLEAGGFEDFSQPFDDGMIEFQLRKNIAEHQGRAAVAMHYDSCFSKGVAELCSSPAGQVDLYYYDGEHSFESQAKALPHFFGAMADTFIYMVDDFAWEPVRDGTRAGFDALAGKIKIEQEWILSDGVPDGPLWHNDVGVWVISKV